MSGHLLRRALSPTTDQLTINFSSPKLPLTVCPNTLTNNSMTNSNNCSSKTTTKMSTLSMEEGMNSIKVVAKIRPLSKEEKERGYKETIFVNSNPTNESVNVISTNSSYEYDAVLSPETSQLETFEKVIGKNFIHQTILQGFNATILAYGQTGSGKTYTMGLMHHNTIGEEMGIIPRVVNGLFQAIDGCKNTNAVTVRLGCLEVYNNQIRDLLQADDTTGTKKFSAKTNGQSPLIIRDSSDGKGVDLVGQITKHVTSPQQVNDILKSSSSKRVTSSTLLNSASSRSHAIVQFTVSVSKKSSRSSSHNYPSKSCNDTAGTVTAKLTLVDLAGSERIKLSGAKGLQQKESININKDLHVLGKVVNALAKNQSSSSIHNNRRSSNIHVPYRDSKLTRLLRDSLGGNCNTIMIACISPSCVNEEESINTLRYAERTRSIKNFIRQNREQLTLSPYESAILRRENNELKMELLKFQQSDHSTSIIASSKNENIEEHSSFALDFKMYEDASSRAERFERKFKAIRALALDAGLDVASDTPKNINSVNSNQYIHTKEQITIQFDLDAEADGSSSKLRQFEVENLELKKQLALLKIEQEKLKDKLNQQQQLRQINPTDKVDPAILKTPCVINSKKLSVEVSQSDCNDVCNENNIVTPRKQTLTKQNLSYSPTTKKLPLTPRNTNTMSSLRTPNTDDIKKVSAAQNKNINSNSRRASLTPMKTPDFAEQTVIRSNAKHLLKMASSAILKSAKKKSNHNSREQQLNTNQAPTAASDIPAVINLPSTTIVVDDNGSNQRTTNSSPCTCNKSQFSGNPDHAEFFLPRLGQACKCGKQEVIVVDPLSLKNILRPWQARFLASLNITTAQQLVDTYKKHPKTLSSTMVVWRQNNGMKSVKRRTCAIAVHIWSRTAKLAIKSKYVVGDSSSSMLLSRLASSSGSVETRDTNDCNVGALSSTSSICSSLGSASVGKYVEIS